MTRKEITILDSNQLDNFIESFEEAVIDFKTNKIDHQEFLEKLAIGLDSIETETIEIEEKDTEEVLREKVKALEEETERIKKELLSEKLKQPYSPIRPRIIYYPGYPTKYPFIEYPYLPEHTCPNAMPHPSNPFIVMHEMGSNKL
ncbi:MAG: hypothetical protein HC836_38440 [Richelia sp. RM2_1_2]|nr:hypothetical protein [Richelia sp. RM2_1_2]